jgi:hypothetical protein
VIGPIERFGPKEWAVYAAALREAAAKVSPALEYRKG